MLNAMNVQSLYNYCQVVGCTDVGRKRQANEDSMGSRETKNGLVAVVCDGMGGHVGGAIASRVSVEAILDFLDDVYLDDPRVAIGEAIDAANRAILQRVAEQPELAGMGSTCVLLLVRDGKVYVGHVGDSRVYLVRNRRIKQLTKDHSFVQMLVDMGQLSPEEAEHHPRKNEITNALGIPEMKPATVLPDAILPEAGDCFVLCSDGLSGMVPDKTIEKVVSRQAEMRTQERADELVRLANENGGVDNITVQLVEFSITPGASKTGGSKKPLMIGLAVLLAILLGAGIYWGVNALKSEPLPAEIKELGGVPFKPEKEVVKIEQKDGKTIVCLIDTVDKWVPKWSDEQGALDGIKVNDTIASLMKAGEGNLVTLKWKNRKDTIAFEMTVAEKRYVFKVWPQSKEQIEETDAGNAGNDVFSNPLIHAIGSGGNQAKNLPEEHGTGEPNTEGKSEEGSSTDAVGLLGSQVEPVSYSVEFKYEKDTCFLKFLRKQGVWEITPAAGNTLRVNQSFEVASIVYSGLGEQSVIKHEKKSETEYVFYFTDKEPEGNFVIRINGKTSDEPGKTPEISAIELNMIKKK